MKSLKLCTLLYLIPMSAMAAQECSQNMTKSAPNARYEFNNNGTIKESHHWLDLDAMSIR